MSSLTKSFALLAVTCGAFATAAGSANHNNMRRESEDGRTPVVLELFTSEGCSSCPPADRFLQTLDEKQPFAGAELIVLSEHVDYWNRLGWTDPYSSKAFSMRQRQYAEQLGLDGVYTPQLVVDGRYEGVGSNAAQTQAAVEKTTQIPKFPLTLSGIVQEKNQVKFHAASPDLNDGGPVTLYVALAENQVRSDVRSGENAGRSLTHVAVVRSLTPVTKINSGSSLSQDFSLALPSGSGPFKLVAFLQSNKSHRILAATQKKLSGSS